MIVVFVVIVVALTAVAAGYAVGSHSSEKKKNEQLRMLELNVNEERMKRELLQEQLESERKGHEADLEREKRNFMERLEAERGAAADRLEAEKAGAAERLAAERRSAAEMLESERKRAADILESERKGSQERIASEKENSSKMLAELEQRYKTTLESMKNEMKHLSDEFLKQKGEELKKSNIEQIGTILNPIKEQMESVKKSVQDVNKETAASKASMDERIKNLIAETNKIGLQADNLSKALKSNTKMQGDWGEQLLVSILENSGLREGIEYKVQENVKDENNRNLRPDVIICCPGNKQIIVDSKVSLTAYMDYVNAQSGEEQERFKKANLDSVKKHIDELSAKNYPGTVQGSLAQVLMFIPNEGSYILALRSDPQIGSYAFKKNVLLINATNLMMSLQLIYNLWQTERQTKNIERIVKESNGLYEKFAGFIENWDKIKSGFASLAKNMEATDKQLCTGPGNVVRRIEGLKKIGGLLPKKEISPNYIQRAEEGLEEETLSASGQS